jgi:hypothetical protein
MVFFFLFMRKVAHAGPIIFVGLDFDLRLEIYV